MSRITFSIVCLLFSTFIFSQETIDPTNQFTIIGNDNKEASFHLVNSNSYKIHEIGDIATVNHLGKLLTNRKNIKGIFLKDVIGMNGINTTKPKELFQYYYILEATDGYRIVLSRNEIFNTDNFYIITSSNGETAENSKDRIEILDITDKGRGHIFIKGLSKIYVKRI